MKRVFLGLVFCLIWGTKLIGCPFLPIGNSPSSWCTKDINMWGNPSSCACEEERIYDEKTFMCFTKGVQFPVVMFEGQLEKDGDNFWLKSLQSDERFKLNVTLEEHKILENKIGLTFEVEGQAWRVYSEQEQYVGITVHELRILE